MIPKKEIDQWLADQGIATAKDVNAGQCKAFAEHFLPGFRNGVLLHTEDVYEFGAHGYPGGHCWILADGLHYDSETPNGAMSWMDLPFFQRAFGPFDIPQHAIPALLGLMDEEMLIEKVTLWAAHMQAFSVNNTVPSSIKGQPSDWIQGRRFTAWVPLLHKGVIESETAQYWRAVLLRDLFRNGITIQTSVSDRLVVETNGSEYRLRHESIGLYREWQWIDQRNTDFFPLDRAVTVLRAIVKRFGNPHQLANLDTK